MKPKQALHFSAAAVAGLSLTVWLVSRGTVSVVDRTLSAWSRLHVAASSWLMHLLGIPVWADHKLLHTDLNTYAIRAGYHGAGVAFTSIMLAAVIVLWRRYKLMESIGLMGASLVATLVWNVVRITLILQFGPSPDTTAMASLLHDTTSILAAMAIISVLCTAVLVESARYARQHKLAPIPGTLSGAVSEVPPFWHRVRQRHRPMYSIIIMLTAIGLILHASRPARRTAILATLVMDMAEQENHELALRLGAKVAAARPDDAQWQLRLIRIRLLAGKTEQALLALARLPEPTTREHAAEIALLVAHSNIRAQHWAPAQTAINILKKNADDDPIWSVILLELALAAGDLENVMKRVVPAAQISSQAPRLRPAIPLVKRSGQWQVLLAATEWISREEISRPILSAQIMAHLQLGSNAAAAAGTQFALQRWPHRPEFLPAVLALTQSNPTVWEPRLAQYLLNLSRHTDHPDKLFTVIRAAFAAHRPDLAWQAYQKLRALRHTLHADLTLATYASQWFQLRSHFLRLPADSPSDTTDLVPLLVLNQHLPFLPFSRESIPYANDSHRMLNTEIWQQNLREHLIPRLMQQQHRSLVTDNPTLHLHVIKLLEHEGKFDWAQQQLNQLQKQNPDMQAIADFHRARLEAETGTSWPAYTRLRTLLSDAPPLTREQTGPEKWPPTPIPLKHQTAQQLPLLLALIDLQWQNQQFMTARFTALEALRRFPQDPTIRTLAADVLLQVQRPEQALHILQNTTSRRLTATNELEAEALRASGRFAALRTFRRQRLFLPEDRSNDTPPPQRLPPAENLFALTPPETLVVQPPVPENPIYPLFQQVATHPTQPPDWEAWLTAPKTRLEQAEAMFLLSQLLYTQNQPNLAQEAAFLAVQANPHEPTLWLTRLRGTPDAETLIKHARTFCPDDPDLWLADLVRTAHATDRHTHAHDLQRIIREAQEQYDFPIETLVRAADFLWRGKEFEKAMTIINLFHRQERGLLAAHLLGMEAAEWSGHQARALYHIGAAIEAAGETAPELYARFIKSKIQKGQIDSDRSVINALRQLRSVEPQNTFWTEMLGFVRHQRGGSESLEAGLDMQNAIRAGSTNRVAFVIAAEGYRRVNRTHDAADILRQGLALWPQDTILLNNLAYTLAENTATAPQAADLIPELIPLAENNPEIRDTLAFVLLRNHQLETAHTLVSQTLRETSPDSRSWFRSQMHLAEIVWRQGRTQVATSMLEQLLQGARNIPDEDVLTANRLLQHISSTAP